MDLANNKAGILGAIRLQKTNACDPAATVGEFNNDMKAGRLVVLTPQKKEPS